MKTLVFTMLISILVIAFSFSEAEAVDTDYVLVLPFDEVEGTVAEDLSPLGNDGTLKGSPKWVEGKFGGALSFDPEDGDVDYVEVANESDYDFERTDDFTFALWVKLSPKASGDHFIIAKEENCCDFRGPYIIVRTSTGALNMLLQSTRANSTQIEGSTQIIDEEWHHVAGVNVGSEGGAPSGIKLYVDGTLETMVTLLDNLDENTILNNLPVTIGSRDKGGVPAKGLIDEVVIVKRALSDGEIQQLATQSVVAAVQPEGKLTTTWGSIKAEASR